MEISHLTQAALDMCYVDLHIILKTAAKNKTDGCHHILRSAGFLMQQRTYVDWQVHCLQEYGGLPAAVGIYIVIEAL